MLNISAVGAHWCTLPHKFLTLMTLAARSSHVLTKKKKAQSIA